MKRILLGLLIALACTPVRGKDFWVSGYYPGWDQKQLPPDKLPFNAITHLFHFAATIQPDGSLRLTDFQFSPPHIKATVTAAHAAGKKVLLVLGGADSGRGFHSATSDAHRERFIANIVACVAEHGYDGVDIDWEPVRKADNAQYRTFVQALRTALRKHDRQALLTAATGVDPIENPDITKLFAALQNDFDQINVMTYVLSGAWEGWISWHGSPLFNGGATFSSGRPLPCIATDMADFTKASVAPEKLGIGLAFHGDVWTGGTGTTTGGVTQPQQKWTTAPKVRKDVYYSQIMPQYYAPDRLHFDPVSQTPYLSIDKPGSEEDVFVSYCDAKAITARMEFMRDKGFGGCIIWHLGQDLLPSGEQPLAAAVAKFLNQGTD